MNVHKLDIARREAHLAWTRAKRPKSGPEFDALNAANRAYADAKKQAMPPAPAPVSAAAATAAVNARKAAQAQDKAVTAAVRLWRRANDYPRHGQGWGSYPGEKTADALLTKRYGKNWQDELDND